MAANAHQLSAHNATDQLDREQANAESLLIRNTDSSEYPREKPPAVFENPVYNNMDSSRLNSNEREGQISNSPRVLSFIYRRWITELLACLVAAIALAAIVITLETHKGRPLPDWPYGISINALVSVFSVILKGTMMVAVAECKSVYFTSCHQKGTSLTIGDSQPSAS
jgi:hypothetical protein